MAKQQGSDYFIPVWNGLTDYKHRKAMGQAVWTYLWLLDQTPKDSIDGYVKSGAVLRIRDIAKETRVPDSAIYKDLQKLNGVYIDLERSSYGFKIRIRKWRKIRNSTSKKESLDFKSAESADVKSKETDFKSAESDFKCANLKSADSQGQGSQNSPLLEGPKRILNEKDNRPAPPVENSQTLKPFVRIEIERYLKDPRCNTTSFFEQRASPNDKNVLQKAVSLVRDKKFDWNLINKYAASLGEEQP